MHRMSFLILVLLGCAQLFGQSPHGKNFSIDCSNCHEATSWKVVTSKITFDHNQTAFKLVGQHINTNCKQCHSTLVFADAKTECFTCHKDIHKNSVGLDCQRCHSPSSWIVSNPVQLHQGTHFPLVGEHAHAECISCHSEYSQLNFKVAGVSCYDCHASNFNATANPNHVAAGFSHECQDCHKVTASAWSQGSFASHNFFPLEQGHNRDCFSCHKQGSFKGLSRECYSCHKQNYESVKVPNHVQSNFSTQCQTCHTIAGWKPASFDHNSTGFQLLGMHKTVDCSGCHKTGTSNTPRECAGCHLADMSKPVNPNHKLANFPQVCTQCHSVNGWKPASFNHATTNFPLVGQHVTVTCNQCHTTVIAGTSTDCASCHQNDRNTPVNPNHKISNFPQLCSQCHSVNGWKPSSFNHATTSFPLVGAHVAVTCNQCHTAVYAGTAKDCYGCHQNDYNTAQSPNHKTLGYPTDCTQCHTATAWSPASFNHAATGFPLTGAHQAVTCAGCHQGTIVHIDPNCKTCHLKDISTPQNPKHNLGNFSQQCDQCHTTSGWKPSSFNHATTSFPLTGAHVTVTCNQCHTAVYAGTAKDCYTCHMNDYNTAQSPNHKTLGYPTDCTQCHITTAWSPASFNHATTGFPLTGAHQAVTCAGCHQGTIAHIDPNCKTCHAKDNGVSQNPKHNLGNFPQQCDQCHTTSGWKPTNFNHAATNFPLTGIHQTVLCNTCHTTQYAGTATICSVCHQSDISKPTNPKHNLGNFSQNCQQCHSTSGWIPSSFNHATTNFPLVGKHLTVTCNSCHTTQYSGTPKDCFLCHQSDYNGASNPNHVAGGYPTDCTQCHTTTAWIPSSFNHATTGFGLTGKHLSITCASCHGATITHLDPTCATCHKADIGTSQTANHTLGNFLTGKTCDQCHTTTVWKPSTFSHATTNFPLTGIHTTTACNTCHTTVYAGTTKDCYTCHTKDYTGSVNPPHASASLTAIYTHTCSSCHSTTGWRPTTWSHTQYYNISVKHSAQTCIGCHTQWSDPTNPQCISCHTTEFNKGHNSSHSKTCWKSGCHTSTTTFNKG